MRLLKDAESVLNQRGGEYLPFAKEAERVCAAVNAIVPGMNLTPRQYAIVLITMKLAREGYRHKRDNLVDLVGYTTLLDGIEPKEQA